MSIATTDPSFSAVDPHDRPHTVPLWGLFLALLALTAAEVALFEVWSHTNLHGHPFIPKYAMVLILLIVLTIPKAAIVLIYFMHLKFERQLVILLAVVPFVIAPLAVLPTLTDAKTLKGWGQTYNLVPSLGDPPKGESAEGNSNEAAPSPTPVSASPSASTSPPASQPASGGY